MLRIKSSFEKLDKEQFIIKDCVVGGDSCCFVSPKHIGVSWNQDNKIFRSLVFRKADYKPISVGFPKFTNWGENPEHFPVPREINDCVFVTKEDGSLLMVSKHNGELVVRTRGTLNASLLNNGAEIDYLKNKYPDAFDYASDKCTLLFEWVTPTNKIVIDYGSEPKLFLVGIISHSDLWLYRQKNLDEIAGRIRVERPKYFSFSSFSEMEKDIKSLVGSEGCVVYSDYCQTLHKVKAEQYLKFHRFKANANIETVLDMYAELDFPDYSGFSAKIAEQFDYECLALVRGFVSLVVDAKKEADNIVNHMKGFAESLKSVSRKEAASKIIKSYGDTNRASFVFKLLDNKPLSRDDMKKILWQNLKK